MYILHSLHRAFFLFRWARYLLPAETATKLKARTRVHFLCAAFYTVHYNARACEHYTVRVIHYQPILWGPWENTETIIARDLWCPWRLIREPISWITRARRSRTHRRRLWSPRDCIARSLHSAILLWPSIVLNATICNRYVIQVSMQTAFRMTLINACV